MLPILGQTTSNQVYAKSSEPKTMADVAANFASYGSEFAGDKSTYKMFDSVGDAWNYFGPGAKSILGSGARGTNVSTYEALKNGLYNSKDDSLEVAARYAYAMSQSGLDHPIAGSSMSGITRGARIVGSWFAVGILSIMFAANTLLDVSFKLFRWINPFCALQYLESSSGGATGKINSLWRPIFDVVRPLYKTTGGIIWIGASLAFVIGVTFALTGHSIITDGSGKHSVAKDSLGHALGASAWKLLRRFIVFVAGPIFIGAFANDLLTDIHADSNLTNTVGYEQIYGNYVDFGGWAQHSRLALPAATKQSDKLTQTGNSAFSRSYILKINADGANNSVAKSVLSSASGKKSTDKQASMKDQLSMYAGTTKFLLGNYASGATYNGTTWESYVDSIIKNQAANYKGAGGADTGAVQNPALHFKYNDGKAGDYSQSVKNNTSHYDGTDSRNKPSSDAKIDKNSYTSDYSLAYSNGAYTSNAPKYGSNASLGSTANAGLSTLGLYNYLNTSADGSGIQYTKPTQFLGMSTINQHASSGFVGRGILFLSSYLLMTILMLSCAVILLFATFIVVQGAISGIPRMIIYAFEFASLRWEGFVGVFKECVSMYVRLMLSQIIVGLFSTTVVQVFDKLEDLLLTGKHAAFGSVTSTVLMPFQVNTSILGFVRLLECVAVLGLLLMMLKSWWDLIHMINRIVEKLLSFFGGKGTAKPNAPKPNKMGNMNSQAGKKGGAGADARDDDALDDPNTYAAMDAKRKDPSLHENDKNLSLGQAMKQQAGMTGLKALDKFNGSKAGQLIKKGAKDLMAHVGGSPLGRLMGFKGRGDGAQSVEKMTKGLQQGAAAWADPTTYNDSADATMTDQEKEKDDAEKEQEHNDAIDKTISDTAEEAKRQEKKAQEDAQKQKNRMDDLSKEVGKDGKLEDPAKMSDVLDATDKGLKHLQDNKLDKHAQDQRERLGNITSEYRDQAKQKEQEDQQVEQQADQAVEQAQDQYDQTKQAYDSAVETRDQLAKQAEKQNSTNPKERKQAQEAQKQLPMAQKKVDQAKQAQQQAKKRLQAARNNRDRISVAHNQHQRAEIMATTGKDIGANGENLRKVTAESRQRARDSQFTAMTGKKAAKIDQKGNATVASPAMIEKAKKAKKEAVSVLSNPVATQAEKADARKTIHDANVVLETGYQYGQFSETGQEPIYANATQAEKDTAKQNEAVAHVVASTGFAVDPKAEKAPAVMQAYNKKIQQAQQIVNTGNVVNEQGQTVPATSDQMMEARQMISTDPEQQIKIVQAQMENVTSSVTQNADAYAQAKVQTYKQNNPGVPQTEIMRVTRDAKMEYMQKPEVMQQLKGTGMISSNATPEQVQTRIEEIQQLGDQTRMAIDASVAPIKRQLALGGFDASSQPISPDVTRKIITQTAVENTRKLNARRTWVDSQHFGKTNYGQIEKALNHLMNANKTGNETKIKQARLLGKNYGISNAILNDPKQQSSVLNEIRNTRDQITSSALSHKDQQTIPL